MLRIVAEREKTRLDRGRAKIRRDFSADETNEAGRLE
jgi:hypothetical protein